MSISLITGLSFEAKIARQVIKKSDHDCCVFSCGMGAPEAEKTVTEAKQSGVKGIISFGVCGGLDPALPAGSIVLPHSILAPQEIPVDLVWRNALETVLIENYDIAGGKLLAAEKTINSIDEKSLLYKQTGACAVDMESGVLAQEAARQQLPFIAVRVVHDPANQSLPPAFRNAIKANGQLDIGNLIKGLIFQWPGLETLKALSSNDRQARANLEGLTRLALPGFGISA